MKLTSEGRSKAHIFLRLIKYAVQRNYIIRRFRIHEKKLNGRTNSVILLLAILYVCLTKDICSYSLSLCLCFFYLLLFILSQTFLDM